MPKPRVVKGKDFGQLIGRAFFPGLCPKKRPCPRWWCKYHLAVDRVDMTSVQMLIYNFGALDLKSMSQTCTLDVAAEGTHTRSEMAKLLNVSKQRIAQIELRALRKLRGSAVLRDLFKMYDPGGEENDHIPPVVQQYGKLRYQDLISF